MTAVLDVHAIKPAPGVRGFTGDHRIGAEREHINDAIEAVDYEFYRLSTASDVISQANALVELSNRVSDLISWHPLFNIDTGRIENFDA